MTYDQPDQDPGRTEAREESGSRPDGDRTPATPHAEALEGSQRGSSAENSVEAHGGSDTSGLSVSGALDADDAIDAVPVEDQPTAHLLHAERWSAPMPSPRAIQGYEDVSPGLGLRAFAMAEKAAETESYVQRSLVDNDADALKRGQIFSSLLVAAALVAAFVLAILGHTEVALACLGVPLLQYASKLVRTVSERSAGSQE